MKTYAVAQMCDKHQLNRLVDRISGKAQSIIDWYKKAFCCDDVLLFKRDYISNDPDPLPKNLLLFEPDKLTIKDIEWLRTHQKRYGMSFIDSIQYDMDKGNLDIFCGLCAPALLQGRSIYCRARFSQKTLLTSYVCLLAENIIFCGICVSIVKDKKGNDEVSVCHKFIIELRHVYDI